MCLDYSVNYSELKTSRDIWLFVLVLCSILVIINHIRLLTLDLVQLLCAVINLPTEKTDQEQRKRQRREEVSAE